MSNPYSLWCRENGCGHGHCGRCECEKPQPIEVGGKLVCGRCACIDGVLAEMVPCRPGICE